MLKRTMTVSILLLLTGCAVIGGGQERDPTPVSAVWTADIQAVGTRGHRGFATGSILTTGETRMNATLTGGSVGGIHPWYIHEGACGETGPVVGSEEEYPELRPDAGGDASATVTLPEPLDPGDEYSVQVHQDEDPTTIVGCGDLALAW